MKKILTSILTAIGLSLFFTTNAFCAELPKEKTVPPSTLPAVAPAANVKKVAPPSAMAPRTRLKPLFQEKRKLNRQIRMREMELQKNNKDVKQKLDATTAEVRELQKKIQTLYKKRPEIFKAADPDLAKLYEHRQQIDTKMDEIRKTISQTRQNTPRANKFPRRPRHPARRNSIPAKSTLQPPPAPQPPVVAPTQSKAKDSKPLPPKATK